MKTLIFIPLIFLTLSCDSNIEESLVYSREGIMEFSGEPAVDGCGWNIKTNKGETFHPVNLTNNFKRDSLEVGLLLKPLDDKFLCSFNVFIPKVEILNIEEL
ncbi:MAG: hypothetical protein ABJ387_05060 [Balneola sp.]